jgi:threonine dehydrogenase-like Zn-dependent dehydrogenase
MLAMVYRGPYRVRPEVKPMPRIEHPNDAIVRVTRAAICGSDLHLYHGLVPDTRVGQTFGHEFTGIVEEVGPNVENLRPGDPVLVPFNIFCGACFFCRKELYGNCHNVNPSATAMGGIYGYSHTTGGYDGGQAEYVRVPMANVGPTRIPDWMHVEDALMLTDACSTGYQAAEMGEIRENDTVLVLGAGPVGLFAARAAWLMGAGRVIVLDHLEYRLEFAARWVPAEAYNFSRIPDVVQFIKELTGLGADVCIDAVGAEADGNFIHHLTGVKVPLQAGSPTALNWCIDAARKGGTVSVVGVYGPTYNLVSMGDVLSKGLRINANQASVKRSLPRLFEHVREGRLRPREIITHRIPLEAVSEGYHIFSSKLQDCIKTVLIPPKAA